MVLVALSIKISFCFDSKLVNVIIKKGSYFNVSAAIMVWVLKWGLTEQCSFSEPYKVEVKRLQLGTSPYQHQPPFIHMEVLITML